MQASQTLSQRGEWGGDHQTLSSFRHFKRLFCIAIVLSPTILACCYYGLIATPRYVSEARFVIRTASKATNLASGLDSILQLVGLSHSQDDAYAVHDFLTSRDAVRQLQSQVDLRAIYQFPNVDLLARYPSFVFTQTDEGFYRYLQHRFTVIVNNTSGLTTLRVEAFRPQDAFKVAAALLDLGEGLVNKLNRRLEEDAVHVAESEVARDEQARIDAQIAVTAFRNRSLILDPGKSSAMVIEVIGQLTRQLADVRTEISETMANSPANPQLPGYRLREQAIEHQIAIERGRVANDSDGLADKIAEYERLKLKEEFAVRSLAQAVVALELARIDARRQQLFLERVVEPGVPDQAMMPQRLWSTLTVFGFNVIGASVLWLLFAGIREHAGTRYKRHS